MNILWLTWKDSEHPLAGGAEVMNEELAKRAVADGHEVKFVVGGFKGGLAQHKREGYEIYRVGSRVSVYFKTWRFYRKNLNEWPDVVIDEINTIPFFARWYVPKKIPVVLFIYQLARQIWFYEMFFPLNVLGYVLEPVYLWLLNALPVFTESESTKKDLQNYGYKKENIHVIPPGTNLQPIDSLEKVVSVKKYDTFTLLSLGAIRSMKQTLDQVMAFELLKNDVPSAKMIIAGSSDGVYGKKVLKYIKESTHTKDINHLGKVSQKQKLEIMQKSHVISVTSTKEGWGLIITEAAGQGTPAVAYNVDGLRDAIKEGKTGLLSEKSTPQSLAQKIIELHKNPQLYSSLQKAGWKYAKELTFDQSYAVFSHHMKNLRKK